MINTIAYKLGFICGYLIRKITLIPGNFIVGFFMAISDSASLKDAMKCRVID